MVEKMKLVRVQGTMPQLNEFIGSCCMDGRFDLEPATRYMSESLGYGALNEENPHTAIRDQIETMAEEANIELHEGQQHSDPVDAEGRILDIEVQRADKGASVRRARFHSSVIDRTLLEKGEDFDALVDTYVIFITEHDKYGAGLPLYHVERTVTELQHTTFGDGAHIIYVNGAFRDLEHPVGRLMHDMNCTDPNKMLNPLLAKEVRYLKETEGGRSQMCRAFEEVARESARDAEYQKAVRTAKKMLALGQLNLETIAECTELSLDEVKALADKKPA